MGMQTAFPTEAPNVRDLYGVNHPTPTFMRIRQLLRSKMGYRRIHAKVVEAMLASLSKIARHMAAEACVHYGKVDPIAISGHLSNFVCQNLYELREAAQATAQGKIANYPASLRSLWTDEELAELAEVYADVLEELLFNHVGSLAEEAVRWAATLAPVALTADESANQISGENQTVSFDLEHVMQRRAWTCKEVGQALRYALVKVYL